ncbi:MAG TPA: hypothetical protein VIE44_10170 [Methylomirabilota bacterium]|jgi:hypothetical protein
MVAAALDALVGGEPADEAVEAALATIPAGELEAALRWLARQHGAAALPILRRCLADRPERAIAAAQALGTVPLPAAADALEAAETRAATKAVRTAARRALYRLRQAGVDRPVAPAPAAPPRVELGEAWVSAVDGTGGRGLWLTLAGPYGERTLLAAVLSDETGLVDFSSGGIPKKRVEERLRALSAESALPWVAVPARWAWATLVAAAERARAAGGTTPPELRQWIERLGAPTAEPAPIHARLPAAAAEDPALLERSASLLALPELAGWFLDPASVSSEALEWLQAKESRLVVSDQIKAERLAALVDRIIEARFGAPARRLWQGRLEDQAYVLLALGRPAEAASAVAVAAALGDDASALRRVPFLRALVERSLEIAGEVATGQLSAEAASRAPRARAAKIRGG